MAKYLIKGSYSSEGIKGVLKEGGSARVAAVKQAVKKVGGKVDSFYFAFGDTDVYVIVDLPDHVAAAALGATVGASGALAKYETVVLLTPADMDDAAALSVSYRPPGA
jgi:uncharacterized protein with GYD domain